jgi:hypothetical protein
MLPPVENWKPQKESPAEYPAPISKAWTAILPAFADELRQESARSFNFPAALQDKYPDKFREELIQMIRFGIFVVTQKLP